MVTCISYGTKNYIGAAALNLETAKLHGADRTILYSPKDIPLSYKLKNWQVFYGRSGKRMIRRGAGFWIWKSYVIQQTFKELSEGDILIYSDGGSVYVGDISEILKTFDEQKLNIMVFSLLFQEKCYTKRDTFILMDADREEFTETRQRLATYVIFRKSKEAVDFVDEWQSACRDPRLITDRRSRLGKNYPGFVSHRHDQSIMSILAKKHGIKEYRDPSQFGNDFSQWPADILERSPYPQIWYSTRDKSITTMEEFKRAVPNPYTFLNP